MRAPDPLGLDGFNKLADRERIHLLFGVCSSMSWARRVLAGGPFHEVDALIRQAERVLYELPDAEIDAALDCHPRIGARPANPSSAREQARVSGADAEVRARLADRNREYEDKFGHVYLVCASDRSGEELLTILSERLGNDPETERWVMRGELAKINRLRLQRLLGESPAQTRSGRESTP